MFGCGWVVEVVGGEVAFQSCWVERCVCAAAFVNLDVM